ncbi:MAG: long-chain fatty acid--CoA ligase [Chitinophagaceae bacterium]|nr:long-chain fatty acid--CoA ligase [Chitinophagaceae bacterium]
MEIKRLFDALDFQLNKFGNKPNMFGAKVSGAWQTTSAEQTIATVNNLTAGLLQLGMNGKDYTAEGADKIAIISNNRPEWVFTDLAVQQSGAILVPLYPTTNSLEIEFILNDSEAKYIFVSDEEMFQKISAIKPNIPSLKKIYSFNHVEGCAHWSELTSNITTEQLQQVAAHKKEIPVEHVATLIYTSGTTGKPKGVMLTHSNLYTCLQYGKQSFPFEDRSDAIALSFLPLNHIFEKVITYIYLFSGISIYYAESLETIGDNIREVKPFGFSCVPRLLEKVYEKIMAKGQELTGIKRSLFFWAVGLAKKYDVAVDGGWWYNLQLKIANKIIFKKWREALGGNIEFIVSGGAACPIHLLRIFTAAGVPIYEGYGPTENSPIISVNRKAEGGRRFGTVGEPIIGIEVKIAEDGEIIVRGSTVMKGYYKRSDLTAETIIDGWLHTGDIGVWVDNKYLKITDRKKELFKTSGGKYVAPQPLENKFKESHFIEQFLIVGADKKFVSALIVPSFTALQNWCKEHDIDFGTNETIIKNPKVIELYQSIIDKYNPLFNHVEQVKKFALLPKEWSIEGGEMTPKMSLKRKVVLENCAAVIDEIYNC